MRTQVLPTKFHAFEDYTTAATLPVLPRAFGWSRTVRSLFDAAAATAVVQSLLTDYEGGAARVLPMRGHLTADVVIGAGFLAAAAALRREPPLARVALAGFGAYAIVLALLTRPRPADR